MVDALTTIHNVQVLVCAPEGPKLASETVAVDIIAEAFSEGASMVLVPVERFDPAFFQLRSGLAGLIIQKFVNYKRQLVVLGDVSQYVTDSRAFHDFVYETNRGKQVWFLPDLAALNARLDLPIR
jgi:hypothetical protein